MKMISKSGTTVAAAAAALLLAGAVSVPQSAQAEAAGYCFGVNACKGQGACKSAKNACKGQNACKGAGFLHMTKAVCDSSQGVFEHLAGKTNHN